MKTSLKNSRSAKGDADIAEPKYESPWGPLLWILLPIGALVAYSLLS